ncbi:MAG: hypothetical protein ACYSW8_27380, partial [Planctomycetota bacterium]
MNFEFRIKNLELRIGLVMSWTRIECFWSELQATLIFAIYDPFDIAQYRSFEFRFDCVSRWAQGLMESEKIKTAVAGFVDNCGL